MKYQYCDNDPKSTDHLEVEKGKNGGVFFFGMQQDCPIVHLELDKESTLHLIERLKSLIADE